MESFRPIVPVRRSTMSRAVPENDRLRRRDRPRWTGGPPPEVARVAAPAAPRRAQCCPPLDRRTDEAGQQRRFLAEPIRQPRCIVLRCQAPALQQPLNPVATREPDKLLLD